MFGKKVSFFQLSKNFAIFFSLRLCTFTSFNDVRFGLRGHDDDDVTTTTTSRRRRRGWGWRSNLFSGTYVRTFWPGGSSSSGTFVLLIPTHIVVTWDNGTVHFWKCKLLFDYQHLLLLEATAEDGGEFEEEEGAEQFLSDACSWIRSFI
jgi:hypothetical protein